MLDAEREKEEQFTLAILQQESVIHKLELMLEQSVDSKAKAAQYSEQISDVSFEIDRLKKQVALAKPQPSYGQSASVQNEVMRLERANAGYKQKLDDMQKELASKIHLKQEIEDWFAEKIAIEFQIERE